MTRLLIVDDNQTDRYLLQYLLQGNGYEVITAVNGLKALKAAQNSPPDMIISDILMPKMDGFTLCRQWKNDDQLKSIPFVFYSATYTDPRDEAFALSLGAESFIVKPADPERLLITLEEVIKKHQQGELKTTLPPKEDEEVLLTQYNQTLIRKLEDKMLQIEETNRELARHVQEVSWQRDRLLILHQLDQMVSHIWSLPDLLELLVKELNSALQTDRCIIWILDESGQSLSGWKHELREPDIALSKIRLDRTHPLVQHLFEHKQTLSIPDLSLPPFPELFGPELMAVFAQSAVLLVPLLQSDQPIGFLLLDDVRHTHPFKPDDVQMAQSVAAQAAVAIENTRLMQNIQRSENRFRNLAENAADIIYRLSTPQQSAPSFDYISPAVKRITQFDPADFYTDISFAIDRFHIDDMAVIQNRLQERVHDDKPTIFRWQHKNGNWLWFEERHSAIRNEEGQIIAFEGVIRDITERLEADETIRLQTSALEASANPILITNRQGVIEWTNPAFSQLTGFSNREAMGNTHRILKSGKHDNAFYKQMWDTILAGDVWQGLITNRRKDGSLYVDHQTITPVKDALGAVTHFITVENDVTQEEEDKQSLALYAARLEALHAIDLAILNETSSQLIVQTAITHLRSLLPCDQVSILSTLNRSNSIVLLATVGDAWSQSDEGRSFALDYFGDAAALEQEKTVVIDDLTQLSELPPGLNQLRENGIRSWISMVLDCKGETIGVVHVGAKEPGIFKPIHRIIVEEVAGQTAIGLHTMQLVADEQQRTAELETVANISAALSKAATRSEMYPVIADQLATLLKLPGIALVILQPESGELKVELSSDEWKSMAGIIIPPDSGVSAFVIETKRPFVTDDITQESRAFSAATFGRLHAAAAIPLINQEDVVGVLWVGRETPIIQGELRVLTAVADILATAVQRTNLFDATQQYATTLEDRVAARTQQLAEAIEQLKQLDQLKSKFVSDVSHELRTPVTNLTLYLALLARGGMKQDKYLQVLQRETDRLGNLINDILNLSRLELGKDRKLSFTQIDLNQIVRDVVESHLPSVEVAGLTLTFTPAPSLPLINGEVNQLGQVVNNLLANATNYTNSGTISVTTRLAEGKNQVALIIRDTGMGIHPDELPYLFQRFFRSEQVNQSNKPGTGLGLAIVKEIVDLHYGHIEVESTLGEGTVFRIWLPIPV